MYLVFQFLTQVHPRSRGEYFHRIRKDFLNCRFTPAHAGNTFFALFNFFLYKVHPRSRGEYFIYFSLIYSVLGSPPLTRGIRIQLFCIPFFARFTPAHAGNTVSKNFRIISHKVHPRSRGEYFFTLLQSSPIQGSPPLTRGIHKEKTFVEKEKRFTPAHAGNTHNVLHETILL